jgi:hypothetical protein
MELHIPITLPKDSLFLIIYTTRVKNVGHYPFKKPEVVNKLRRLHDKFVLVPADRASKNIVFVCKNYYYECL